MGYSQDYTTGAASRLVCLPAGTAVAATWAALTNTGKFSLTVDATVITDCNPDFTGDTTMALVADSIQTALQLSLAGTLCTWNVDHFEIVSPIVGNDSRVTILRAPSVGTDLAAAGYMNGKQGSTNLMSYERDIMKAVDAGFLAGATSAALATVQTGLEGGTNAVNRVAGKTQILLVPITAAANAAPVTLATVTTKSCLIKSIVIRSAGATTADLTSFNVKGGAGSVITFIDDVMGLLANVAAADQQVAWSGSVALPATGTITFDPTGTGATALDMYAVIEYMAVENTGYLV